MKLSSAICLLVAISGFLAFSCLAENVHFPEPDHGFDESPVSYDSSSSANPYVLDATATSGQLPLTLAMPSATELQKHDAIRLIADLPCDKPNCEMAVVILECSRRHKNTTQILTSASEVFELRNRRVAIDLAVLLPPKGGRYQFNATLLAIDSAGQPIGDEPLPLLRCPLNIE